MALSFQSVEKAFKVFNALQLKDIQSWTPDFQDVTTRELEDPHEQRNYGIGKKHDDGWENLFFFIKNPSAQFIQKWDELKKSVPNTSFMIPHKENKAYTCFGWF